MDLSTRIAAYLATEQHRDERFQSAYELDPLTRQAYIHAKEFYWTLTRLAGRLSRGGGAFSARDRRAAPPRHVEPAPPTGRPRVLIDMTATQRAGGRTGIQRVVGEIAKWAVATGEGLPVFIEDGRLRSYYRHPALPETVEPAPADKFLMLDASFCFVDEYPPIMRAIAASGGENVFGLYDILPLLYPGAFTGGAYLEFQRWFETIAPASDAIVCISRSTAQSLVDYLAQHDYPRDRPQPIGWWRLGADVEPDGGRPSRRAVAIAATRAPFFLGVGTLEPRKGYSIALDAFERLWAAGINARYVIVGGRGWGAKALEQRIRAHAEIDRRLFWLNNADDASLRHLYERAHGLISASFAEGFGLPLAEAAFRGLPAIVSDIPIFREIAGERATFFPPLDAEALSDAIRNALKACGPRAPARALTWRESTQTLLGMIRAGSYQWNSQSGGEGCHVEPVCVASAAAS